MFQTLVHHHTVSYTTPEHHIVLHTTPEHHILEDINQCVEAIQGSDGGMLDETSGRIRSRCGRVCGVVENEMLNFKDGGLYVDRVMQTVQVLRDQSLYL